SPWRNGALSPYPASAKTQPKRTPAAMARSISARAISGFVRAVRYSAGTPARSNRSRLLVQLSGRNSRNASTTGTSPRESVSDTRVWQLAVLPSAEAYCALNMLPEEGPSASNRPAAPAPRRAGACYIQSNETERHRHLETVPDLDGFAAANDLVGKSDVEVREAIGDKFPKHIYHSIVCIGALIAHRETDHWAVDAVGAPHVGERTEKQLITAFCEKIAELHQIGTKPLIGFDIIDWPIGIVSQ